MFALENWSTLRANAPLDKEGKPLSFLNVGTGIDLTIKDLAELVASAVGFEGSIRWDQSKPDGTPKKQLDVSHLSNMGWKAKIKLSDGLKRTVKDFEKSEHRRGIDQ